MEDAFAEPRRIVELMHGFSKPWFVAGGWGVDLFLGRATRVHEDIEIAILRRDQEALWRHFSGWGLEKVVPQGGGSHPWNGEWLAPPIHEIHVKRTEGEVPRLEILIDEAWGDTWRFRRNLAVTRPLAELGLHSPEGIPFLAPEVVLLYKAKNSRPHDEQDFRAALLELDANQRRWLRGALGTVHPGHPWIADL